MESIAQFPGVYLIHFDSKLTGHAQHYIGWSKDVFTRFAQHKSNQGARILEVCNERGIGYSVVRVWRGRTRSFERQLKNRKNTRILCPVCNPFSAEHYPTNRQARKPQEVACPF